MAVELIIKIDLAQQSSLRQIDHPLNLQHVSLLLRALCAYSEAVLHCLVFLGGLVCVDRLVAESVLDFSQFRLLLMLRMRFLSFFSFDDIRISEFFELAEDIGKVVPILYAVLQWLAAFAVLWCQFRSREGHQKGIASVFFVFELMTILLMDVLSLIIVAEPYFFGGLDNEILNFVLNFERQGVTRYSDTWSRDLPNLHCECFVPLSAYFLDGAYFFLGGLQLSLPFAVQLFAYFFAVEAILSWKDVIESDSIDDYLRHFHVLAGWLLETEWSFCRLVLFPPGSLAKFISFCVVSLPPELVVALEQVRTGVVLPVACLFFGLAGQYFLFLLLKWSDSVGFGFGEAVVVFGLAKGFGVGCQSVVQFLVLLLVCF